MQLTRSVLPFFAAWLVLAGLLAACATDQVVPAHLEQEVDQHLTFAMLKESPESYSGRLVVLGGEVLTAKRTKAGTRIEVLELPLEYGQEPGLDRLTSGGRFLALHREFLDPATLPAGTRVTVLGRVTGSQTLPLDETDYTYPTLEINTIKVWAKQEYPYRYGPYVGPYYYRGPYWHPYWGPYWRPHPYWW